MQKITTGTLNDDVCDRISTLVKEKGLNIVKLADKTGIAVGTIQRVLSNPNSNPTYSTLKSISDALGVSIGELLGEIEPAPQKTKKVRLVTWEDALTLSHETKPERIPSTTEFISTNLNVSAKAFALRMKGSHMLPLFPENTVLVFDPAKECYDRAYVLVKLKEFPNPVFKQLMMDEPHWYIKSLSPDLTNDNLIKINSCDRVIAVLAQSLLSY